MKMKIYINSQTNETVYEDKAEEFALDKLGITITPKGKNGEMTQEQIENIQETVEWFYSGDWYEDYIEDDEGDVFELINEENYYDDL